MTCPCTRAARRTRRRDVVLELARSSRYHYLHFALRLAADLFEAARDARPDEAGTLRELARTLRAGARFAQRGAE
ncbi:MAG: hypothetical protein U0529_23810 [Thermoanaerobaculia bacterium]